MEPSSKIKMMAGGHHVLEEVASRRHEMLGPVLSVWTHAGLSSQQNAHVMWTRVMMLKVPISDTTQGAEVVAFGPQHTSTRNTESGSTIHAGAAH